MLNALERLLNRMLAADPETLDGLAALAGKVIQVELLNTRHPLIDLAPGADGVRIAPGRAGGGDVLIRGAPLDLLLYLYTARQGGTQTAGNLEIKGDLSLAQDFQRLLRRLEFDWEERLARALGDAAARKAGVLAGAGLGWLRQLRDKTQADLVEYVRYEAGLLPGRDEVDGFNDAVDTLRDDSERLRQRLERLAARRGAAGQ